MYKKIIVFEGVDGSGKSYHINQVSKFLRRKKIKHIKFREPGGSKNSEKIRKLILNNKSTLLKKTDFLLYIASRNENYENLIKPNLNKKIILIDRFILSTLAYQHYGFKINKRIINNLNKFTIGNLKPSFTFLHILPESKLKKKISGNKNKYDKFDKKFYKKVQNGFKKMLKKNNNKLIVKSSYSKEINKKIILDKIKTILKIND